MVTKHSSIVSSTFKRFFSITFLYLAGDIFPRALSLILLPVYARFLTPSDYGITNAMSTFGSILTLVCGLGFGAAVMRTYFDQKNPARLQEHISSAWLANQVWALAVTAILLVAAPFVGPAIYKSIPYSPYFYITILTTLFANVGLVPLSLLKVEERPGLFVSIGVFRTLLGACLTLLLVVVLRRGALGTLVANLAAAAILATVYTVIMRKWLTRRFVAGDVWAVARIGLPLVPHTLVGWILTLGDRILIERYVGLASLGIYSMGYQFGQLLEYAVDAGARAIPPIFFRLAERGQRRQLEEMTLLGIALVLLTGTGLTLFLPEIIQLLVGDRYAGAAGISVWIIAAGVLKGMYVLATTWVFFKKQTVLLPLYSGLAAAVNLALNLVLIPRFGIHGAAGATVASYALLFITVYRFSQRLFPIVWGWSRLKWLALCYLLSALAYPWIAGLGITERLIAESVLFLSAAGVGLRMMYPLIQFDDSTPGKGQD